VTALAALAWWAARDLPRRWLEGRLAAALDAEVRLSRLEIESLRHFVLHGLELRRPGWEPRIETVLIDRLDVQSPIRELLEDRYEALTVDGLEVRLVPPARPVRPLPESETRVRRIEVRRGRALAEVEGRQTRVDFTAMLRDRGAGPTGEVSLEAQRIDGATLAGLAGSAAPPCGSAADDLRVHLELLRDPAAVRARASAGDLRVSCEGHTAEFRQPAVEASAVLDEASGTVRLIAEPVVEGIASARLEATLDGESYALRDGRAELRGITPGALLPLPDGWVVQGTANLEARTDDGQTIDYDASCDLERVVVTADRGSAEGRDLHATVRGSWRSSAPFAYEVDATLAGLRVVSDTVEVSGAGASLSASGDLAPASGGRLDARLRLPRGDGRFGPRELPAGLLPLEVEIDGRLRLEPDPALDAATTLVSPALGRVRIEGVTDSPASGPTASLRWSWSSAPDLADLLRLVGQRDTLVLHGRPRASGTVEGALHDPAVRGRVAVEGLEIAEAGWTLSAGSAATGFRRNPGDRGRVALEAIEVTGDLGQESPAWGRALRWTAGGEVDLRQQTARLTDSRATVEGLAQLAIEGERRGDGSLVTQLTLAPAELSPLRELLRQWIDDPYPEHVVKGSIAARLEGRLAADRSWRVDGDVSLDGAGFSSPDGSRVVEGASGAWQVRLAGGEGSRLEGSAGGALHGPVMLWGTLFGDFSPLGSELDLALESGPEGWQTRVDWKLPHDVSATARLSAGLTYSLDAEVPDLAAFLEHYIRVPFEGSVENVDTLRAAGALRVALGGVLGEEQSACRGRLTATAASFSGALGDTAIDGLDLDLPLALEWRTQADGRRVLVAGEGRAGSLGYRRLRLSGVELPALETGLTVVGDTIRLDRPVRLALLDGEVELRQVALAEWSRPSRHLRFGLDLNALSLEALTTSLGMFPLEGALDGSFQAVRLTRDRLEVDGGGRIGIFGGDVEVYDISGEDVLSRFPKFRFSAKLGDIHLLDLTRTLDFGEVYGVAQGEIRDCELFRGVPVRCEAEVHTVESKGVPRKISVRAVRNISILGSGDRVGFLDRGIQRFFDTYTYSKIGITMRLRNDRFVLRGTERRGDRELFVKGRLPFRIDIVNVAPGQAVSFQTMLARLENLEIGSAPPVH